MNIGKLLTNLFVCGLIAGSMLFGFVYLIYQGRWDNLLQCAAYSYMTALFIKLWNEADKEDSKK